MTKEGTKRVVREYAVLAVALSPAYLFSSLTNFHEVWSVAAGVIAATIGIETNETINYLSDKKK